MVELCQLPQRVRDKQRRGGVVRVGFADGAKAEGGGLVELSILMIAELVAADALDLVAVGAKRLVEGERQEEVHCGHGRVLLGKIALVRGHVVPEPLRLGEHGMPWWIVWARLGVVGPLISEAGFLFDFAAVTAGFFVAVEPSPYQHRALRCAAASRLTRLLSRRGVACTDLRLLAVSPVLLGFVVEVEADPLSSSAIGSFLRLPAVILDFATVAIDRGALINLPRALLEEVVVCLRWPPRRSAEEKSRTR